MYNEVAYSIIIYSHSTVVPSSFFHVANSRILALLHSFADFVIYLNKDQFIVE